MKSKLLLLSALSFVLFFSSCSDDEVAGPKNSLTINGKSFAVVSVSLLGVSIDGQGHAGVTFAASDGSAVKSLTVDFDYSPASPVTGTYSFPLSGSNRLLDDWLTSYTEFSGSTVTRETHLQSGSFTIKDNGNSNYTFSLDLKMEDGSLFKGSYTGKVQTVFNNG